MTKNKTGKVRSKIESQEVIAEASRKNYEVIRLTRIRYKDNPYSFIDLRLYQSDPSKEEEILYPTKKGIQFREDHFQKLIGKWTLIPSLLFNKTIIEKAWPYVEQSKFDDAVFKAFKAVEINVRKACRYSAELIGVKLMRKAFDPGNGLLTDYSVPKAERQAVSDLFCGTIGLYKNPHSHRDVQVEFNDAFEMLMLASHLLNIVGKRKNQRSQNKST